MLIGHNNVLLWPNAVEVTAATVPCTTMLRPHHYKGTSVREPEPRSTGEQLG